MRIYVFVLYSIMTTSALATNPPRDMPTTNLVSGFNFSPIIYDGASQRSTGVPNLVRLGISVETAIYYYLNGGVAMAALAVPRSEPSFFLHMSPYIKPQYPIDTSIGRFTFYSTLSLGTIASYWTGPEINNLLASTLGPSGFGLQGTAVGGAEFFFIPPFGIFVEGGYSGGFLWVNRVTPQYSFATLAMHGPVLNFGLRVAL